MILTCLLASLAAFCFPAAHDGNLSGIVLLTAAYFVLSVAGSAITVYAWTIRQTLTPKRMLGKMNGAFRFCVTGVMPFGALFGGWLGGCIGIRTTPVLVACGWAGGCLLACFSPLRSLRTLVSPD